MLRCWRGVGTNSYLIVISSGDATNRCVVLKYNSVVKLPLHSLCMDCGDSIAIEHDVAGALEYKIVSAKSLYLMMRLIVNSGFC